MIFERIDGGVQIKLKRKPKVKISDDCEDIVIYWKPNDGKESYLKISGSDFIGYRSKSGSEIIYNAELKPSAS